MQSLQRISTEEGNLKADWDLHLRQALLAFHAHANQRLGTIPFFLQFGTEPALPSTSIVNAPVTRPELAEQKMTRAEPHEILQDLDVEFKRATIATLEVQRLGNLHVSTRSLKSAHAGGSRETEVRCVRNRTPGWNNLSSLPTSGTIPCKPSYAILQEGCNPRNTQKLQNFE